jgi:hypothetical protein
MSQFDGSAYISSDRLSAVVNFKPSRSFERTPWSITMGCFSGFKATVLRKHCEKTSNEKGIVKISV